MAQKTADRPVTSRDDLLQGLLSAVEADNVSTVELNVSYTIDADGEAEVLDVAREEATETHAVEERLKPVEEDTKEEAVLMALDQLGRATSTEINEVVGFTSAAKASSTLIRLEGKEMVERFDAPEESNCQYAFDLSDRGREWVASTHRTLEDNQYYTDD